MHVTHFRRANALPPGICVVTSPKGEILWFGQTRDVEFAPALPDGALIHLAAADYVRLGIAARQAVPNAPSTDELPPEKRPPEEFAGEHKHPVTGAQFEVSTAGHDGGWIWRGFVITLHGKVHQHRIDQTTYPTAEGAYLAAIGE